MPSFFKLASGGLLALSGQNGILKLEIPDYVSTSEAELYEIDRIEDALKTILQNQLGMAAKVFKKRETQTSVTPRVELIFTATQNEGRRFLRFLTNGFAPFQPLNTWNYTIQPTIVTNRNNNTGALPHSRLVGLVRWSLQYHRLYATITDEILPYHEITSIIESATEETTIDDENDWDMTRLTFSGMANIKDSAWPPL